MPTKRRRFQVTQTAEVERALDVAARRWPNVDRAELVRRLFETASQALDEQHKKSHERRLAAIDFSSGSLQVAYDPQYLEDLRDEWPA